MKKILFRKLSFDYLKFMTIALISTSVVIWVFQAVNFLDIMIEDGRDYLVYINYSLLNFPKILSRIFPFVLFFSIFYITIKYELNNELIIFWNFGVPKLQIINFIFKISLFLFLFQLILTTLIIPKSQDSARSFLKSSKVNFFGNFIRAQKFNDTIKGLTIYSDRKDKEDNLYNIYIKREISKNEFQITYAKKGMFKEVNNAPLLILYNGTTVTSINNKLTKISFSKFDFSLKNLESNTTTYKKTQEISTSKIIKCIYGYYKFTSNEFINKNKEIENCTVQNINNIIKELYKRFIIPFYIPLLSLIPCLLILTSKENSRYFRTRYTVFLIGFCVIVFSETTIRFISELLVQNLILTFIPIILILILYLYLIFKFKINFGSVK